MNSIVTFTIDDATKGHIKHLALITGKPEEKIMREAMVTGLKNYQLSSNKSVNAVLDLIAWAEKEQITSKEQDLSINHSKYAWDD